GAAAEQSSWIDAHQGFIPGAERGWSVPQIGGQAPLVLELLEGCLHCDRGRTAKFSRDVVPHLREEGAPRALPAIERGDQPALSHQTVLDVLGDLRLRVVDLGPMTGVEDLEIQPLQTLQGAHVVEQRAACVAWPDDRGAKAEDQIPGEARLAEQGAEVVCGVPRGRDRLE